MTILVTMLCFPQTVFLFGSILFARRCCLSTPPPVAIFCCRCRWKCLHLQTWCWEMFRHRLETSQPIECHQLWLIFVCASCNTLKTAMLSDLQATLTSFIRKEGSRHLAMSSVKQSYNMSPTSQGAVSGQRPVALRGYSRLTASCRTRMGSWGEQTTQMTTRGRHT